MFALQRYTNLVSGKKMQNVQPKTESTHKASLMVTASLTHRQSYFRFYGTLCHLTTFVTQLTPCTRILLEKVTGSQLVKKFPTFYGTRRFITAFTSSRHLSLY